MKEILIKNFAVISTLIGTIVGAVIGFVSNYILKKIEIKNEEKCNTNKRIENNLQQFYYPMLLLIKKNKDLYDVFSKGKSKDYKTLIHLLDNESYNENDKVLLDEIIKLDVEINDLILANKGLVDGELGKALAKASTHFTFMQLASEKKIIGEKDRFEEYIYPKNLQKLIEDKIKTLEKEIGK